MRGVLEGRRSIQLSYGREVEPRLVEIRDSNGATLFVFRLVVPPAATEQLFEAGCPSIRAKARRVVCPPCFPLDVHSPLGPEFSCCYPPSERLNTPHFSLILTGALKWSMSLRGVLLGPARLGRAATGGIQDMVAALSPLKSTLSRNFGKHFISLDFNPLRIRTYASLDRNSFGMCTY